MRVISRLQNSPFLHFQATLRGVLEDERNASKTDVALDSLLRAVITPLWFVTLHSLHDGNGRVSSL